MYIPSRISGSKDKCFIIVIFVKLFSKEVVTIYILVSVINWYFPTSKLTQTIIKFFVHCQ